MPVGFKSAGIGGRDLDDYYVRAEYFTQGGLWTFGTNDHGLLGDNTTVAKSSPVQTVAGGNNWKTISGGGYAVAAIKTDGTLWTWGRAQFEQLGDNTSVSKSSPVQTIAGGTNWKSATSGGHHMVAIKTDGTLWTWGRGATGTLGDNTVVGKASPVQTVSGGTNWKSASAGGYNSMAIKTDGTLWVWGNNDYGSLGDNTIAHKSSPVQTVSGGTNWKYALGSHFQTTAIKTDGTLWTWGRNDFGQLGDNTIVHRSSPVQTVAGGTNWKLVDRGDSVFVAIKTDGTLWTWGRNTNGQLGDDTTTHRSSPVQTIAGGANWKSVSGHGGTVAAIKTDGTLWTWGAGDAGQLGDNTVVAKSSPVQTLSGGTNWKSVACARRVTLALTII